MTSSKTVALAGVSVIMIVIFSLVASPIIDAETEVETESLDTQTEWQDAEDTSEDITIDSEGFLYLKFLNKNSGSGS